MVRNGINDAEEVLHAGITNEPARDVSDRDDDRLRCAAGRGACDGGVNSPGDWKQLQEPPAEQLDSYRADAMEKILSVPVGAPTPTLSDCTGAPTTITVTGTASGSGAALLSTGDVDFSQTAGSAGDPA